MQAKKTILMALAAAAGLGLVACGGTAGETERADEAAATTQAVAEAPGHAGAPAAEMDDAAMGADPSKLVVYKTANCGCCGSWAEHMAEAGFDVMVHEVSQEQLTSVKQAKGVDPELASCHTAEIGGYVVEGHVPASDVKRLLDEQPEGVAGLAVPGMPIGSPGMEDPTRPNDAYDVVTFTADGKTEVFASH
ncbi:MAG: DUF411 domain-containing protein [Gemmatimonadota bacterium]|nr:DUF411 domain-containing protein [Gemmatimonadota bacterium]